MAASPPALRATYRRAACLATENTEIIIPVCPPPKPVLIREPIGPANRLLNCPLSASPLQCTPSAAITRRGEIIDATSLQAA